MHSFVALGPVQAGPSPLKSASQRQKSGTDPLPLSDRLRRLIRSEKEVGLTDVGPTGEHVKNLLLNTVHNTSVCVSAPPMVFFEKVHCIHCPQLQLLLKLHAAALPKTKEPELSALVGARRNVLLLDCVSVSLRSGQLPLRPENSVTPDCAACFADRRAAAGVGQESTEAASIFSARDGAGTVLHLHAYWGMSLPPTVSFDPFCHCLRSCLLAL